MEDKLRSALLWVLGILETVVGKILGLLALAAALPAFLVSIGHPLKRPYSLVLPFIVLLALLVPYAVKGFKLPFWRPLLWVLGFVPVNLCIWIFGNIAQHRRLKDVHLVTKFLQESALFARVIGLRAGVTSKYFILFSHKKDNNDNHHIGHGERYRIPGFPVDEAECIIRLWYLAASSLHLSWTNIQAQCSCTWDRAAEKDRILGGSLAIVGSPLKNHYAAELMNEIKKRERTQEISRHTRITMEVKDEICYLNGDLLGELIPDSTKDRRTGDQLTDYALLMKIPNLLPGANQKSSSVLLLAGCKVAGQVALTDWFSEPSNMGELASSYGTDPFQIAFKITYKFVQEGLPIILANEELHREKISVQSKVATAVAGTR